MNKKIITQFLDESFDSISKYIVKKFAEDIQESKPQTSSYHNVLLGKIDWNSERYNDVLNIIKNNMCKFGMKKILVFSHMNYQYHPINDLFLKTITHILLTNKGYMITNSPNLFSFNKNTFNEEVKKHVVIASKENRIRKLIGITVKNDKSFIENFKENGELYFYIKPYFYDDLLCSFILEIEDTNDNSFIFSVVLNKEIKNPDDPYIYSNKINTDFIIDQYENLENFQDITFKVKNINSLNSLLSFYVAKDIKSKLYDSNRTYDNNKSYNKRNKELKMNCYENIAKDLQKYINKNVQHNFDMDIILKKNLNVLRMFIFLEEYDQEKRKNIISIELKTRCINYNKKSKMMVILREPEVEYNNIIKIGEIIKCIGEYFENKHFSEIVDNYKKNKKELDNIKNEKINEFFKIFNEKKSLEYLITKLKFTEDFQDSTIIKNWEVNIYD